MISVLTVLTITQASASLVLGTQSRSVINVGGALDKYGPIQRLQALQAQVQVQAQAQAQALPAGADVNSGTDRSKENSLVLGNAYNFYLTNLTVGNPPQVLELGLDTGSPWMWVFGPNNSAANGTATRFYPDQSSSFVNTCTSFFASYGAGIVGGTWVKDSVSFGWDKDEQNSDPNAVTLPIAPAHQDGATVDQFPFGLVDDFFLTVEVPGLLGVGPGSNLTNETYTNMPEALYQAGAITSPIFSVVLDSSSGHFVFGGYDTSAISGPVYEYDIQLGSIYPGGGSQAPSYYQLRVDSADIIGGSGPDTHDYIVSNIAILDTGSPVTVLPSGLVDKLAEKLGLTPFPEFSAYYINGTQEIDPSVTLSLTLGHLQISMPVSDLLVPGEYVWANNGPANVTALGVVGASQYLLGDMFFKNAFTAFDSLNSKVYLAKRNLRSSPTVNNVVDIDGARFPNAVAGFVPPADPVSTTMASQFTTRIA